MTEGSVSQIKAKIKVVFLGDQSTGKTSIITRFINNKFEQDIGPTVGIDFLAKNVSVGQHIVRLQLWDTAGQERFRSLIPNYLKDALVALLIFDLSNRRTFENLAEWVELYNENKHDKAVLMLVGNKADLPVREVSFEQASSKAKELGVEYYETSAKTSVNIDKLFSDAARSTLKDLQSNQSMLMRSNIQSERKPSSPTGKPDYNRNASPIIELNNSLAEREVERKGKRCCS